jgi:hypothetical protein
MPLIPRTILEIGPSVRVWTAARFGFEAHVAVSHPWRRRPTLGRSDDPTLSNRALRRPNSITSVAAPITDVRAPPQTATEPIYDGKRTRSWLPDLCLNVLSASEQRA